MRAIKFSNLLLPDGWSGEITITVNEEGKIVSKSNKPIPCDLFISGLAVSGFINAHSHAFQYAMVGLTENVSQQKDNFWSWREIMYRIAAKISPDQLEAIAAMLYTEMLRNGFTHVVEFHYLHHGPKGEAYSSVAEMGERLLRAAQIAGIGISLIPIFYQKGGFGVSPSEPQKRFISPSIDQYDHLVRETTKIIGGYSNAFPGYGVHSLRAVNPEDVIAAYEAYNDGRPFHLHISEQPQEVADCLAHHGQRPVDWLCDHLPIHERTHLVHATHISGDELIRITSSGAHVVLCPSTEGNLGDGIFPFTPYINNSGNFSIGTDSHIGLNPMEELRWLDYQQRLLQNKRRPFDQQGPIGNRLFTMAHQGGAAAAGISQNFDIGDTLNVLELNDDHPLIGVTSQEHLLNTLLYASDSTMIKRIVSCGKVVIDRGKHHSGQEIARNFRKAISSLKIR